MSVWFERDRAHVAVHAADEIVFEWWDADVFDLVEDGFVNPRAWHNGAIEYAEALQVL